MGNKAFKNAFIVMIFENYIQHTGKPTVAKRCLIIISSVDKVNLFLNHESYIPPMV